MSHREFDFAALEERMREVARQVPAGPARLDRGVAKGGADHEIVVLEGHEDAAFGLHAFHREVENEAEELGQGALAGEFVARETGIWQPGRTYTLLGPARKFHDLDLRVRRIEKHLGLEPEVR